jgi:hypothetical protein
MIQAKKFVVRFEDFMVVTMNVTEKYCTQVVNTMYFGESLIFWSNISPPCLESKSKPKKKPAEAGVKLMNQVSACFYWFLARFTP